jgi:hypothetical protein
MIRRHGLLRRKKKKTAHVGGWVLFLRLFGVVLRNIFGVFLTTQKRKKIITEQNDMQFFSFFW